MARTKKNAPKPVEVDHKPTGLEILPTIPEETSASVHSAGGGDHGQQPEFIKLGPLTKIETYHDFFKQEHAMNYENYLKLK